MSANTRRLRQRSANDACAARVAAGARILALRAHASTNLPKDPTQVFPVVSRRGVSALQSSQRRFARVVASVHEQYSERRGEDAASKREREPDSPNPSG